MPEMTKEEFAARLLFWLLPWPISKALPRSLRIYYFGPGAGPPTGWYDYFGIPVWFDPDVPPYDEFILDPPVDPPSWWDPSWPPYDDFIANPPDKAPPWWPINPYNPPSADQFPDFPYGPTNLWNPYVPGPDGSGGPNPPQPQEPPSSPWLEYFDDSYLRPIHPVTWDDENQRWVFPLGLGVGLLYYCTGCTWQEGFRPTHIRVTHTDESNPRLKVIDEHANNIVNVKSYKSGTKVEITWSDWDFQWLELWSNECFITNIEWYYPV